MNITIKKVPVEKILPLRQKTLRPGKSFKESTFPNDKATTTFHLALEVNGKIEAVASLMRENSEHSSAKNQYRLRGMAVSAEQRGQNFGKLLFDEAVNELRSRKIPFLWFNARTSAVGFYKKQGCQVSGGEFVIPDVGPHFLMVKKL